MILAAAAVLGVAVALTPVAAADEPDIVEIVCAPHWTWDCGWALRVVHCESSGDVLAYNPAGPYVSWWQVLNGSFDPWTNTAQAHQQFQEWQQGLRGLPWPHCGRF